MMLMTERIQRQDLDRVLSRLDKIISLLEKQIENQETFLVLKRNKVI
jgi:hypothetical protein